MTMNYNECGLMKVLYRHLLVGLETSVSLISALAEIPNGHVPNPSWKNCHHLSQCALHTAVNTQHLRPVGQETNISSVRCLQRTERASVTRFHPGAIPYTYKPNRQNFMHLLYALYSTRGFWWAIKLQ